MHIFWAFLGFMAFLIVGLALLTIGRSRGIDPVGSLANLAPAPSAPAGGA